MGASEIASVLSQQVLEMRRCRGELATPPLDETNRDVQAVHRPIRGIRREMDDTEPVVIVGLRPAEDRRHG